jgi:hypothetical protein
MKEIKTNENEVGLESSNALNFNPGIQRKCDMKDESNKEK